MNSIEAVFIGGEIKSDSDLLDGSTPRPKRVHVEIRMVSGGVHYTIECESVAPINFGARPATVAEQKRASQLAGEAA